MILHSARGGWRLARPHHTFSYLSLSPTVGLLWGFYVWDV